MSRFPRRLVGVLLFALGWALACADNGELPEHDVVGIWSRDAGDGVTAIREFDGDGIAYTNRNWVVVDGAPRVLFSEARYWVTEDEFVPGGGTRKQRVLRVDAAVPTYDEIESINDTRLKLRSLADEQIYEYEKIDALP